MSDYSPPMDSVSLTILLDDEGNPATIGMENLSDSMPEENREYLSLLLKGLEHHVYLGGDVLASIGSLISSVEEFDSQQGMFEPAEEVLNKREDSKVVPINGKKHLN